MPINCYAEVEGTKVNMEGRWQSCNKVVTSSGEAKEAWKVLRMLGSELHINGFDYRTIEDVQAEISSYIQESFQFSNDLTATPVLDMQQTDEQQVYCIGSLPIYSIDTLVRNASSLQMAQGLEEACAHINPSDIQKYGLIEGKWVKVIQGEEGGIFQCVSDDNILPGTVHITRALPRSEKLGAVFGPVELKNLSVA